MPRFRRIVVPGFPHHVTDRGNRRSNVFLDDSDRLVFLHSLHESAEHYLLSIFSYSLTTNHFRFSALRRRIVPSRRQCTMSSGHTETTSMPNTSAAGASGRAISLLRHG